MKRDMDLIRQLLLSIEERHSTAIPVNPIIEGYDPETVGHHVLLLIEAGLLDGVPETAHLRVKHSTARARRLTWSGHEALEVMRSDTVWTKTKSAVAKIGGASIPIWIELATGYAKEQLGLKP